MKRNYQNCIKSLKKQPRVRRPLLEENLGIGYDEIKISFISPLIQAKICCSEFLDGWERGKMSAKNSRNLAACKYFYLIIFLSNWFHIWTQSQWYHASVFSANPQSMKLNLEFPHQKQIEYLKIVCRLT